MRGMAKEEEVVAVVVVRTAVGRRCVNDENMAVVETAAVVEIEVVRGRGGGGGALDRDGAVT